MLFNHKLSEIANKQKLSKTVRKNCVCIQIMIYSSYISLYTKSGSAKKLPNVHVTFETTFKSK